MTTLLIIIFFLLLPTLIIGFLAILEGRRKKQIKKALQEAIGQLVNKNELLIIEIDYFGHKAIGIDRNRKKLLFVTYYKGFVDQICIDLKTLVFCRVGKTKDEYSKDVKKVFIEVKNKGNTEVSRLVFYDRSSDPIDTKTSMIKMAEYWKTKINLHRRTVHFNYQFECVL